MAPKRPSPLEEPPSASETEEEEDLDGSEEEEDEDEVEPPKPLQSSLNNPKPKPNPTPTSLPKPQPSSSDDSDDDETPNPNSSSKPNPPQEEDSDSEEETSDSDSDNEPVKHMIAQRSANAKPISSKPMPAATKSNKPPPPPTTPTPASAATPVPSRPAPKRPLDDDGGEDKKTTKKKKVSETHDEGDNNTTDDSEKKTAGDDKKPPAPFQRIWTDETEIIILNGLIDFKKNGYNVSTNLGAYYDFIKDSLHFDVSKPQLNNKVQKLKIKYLANASKAKYGEDPVLSRPHETEAYRLSKEIWGEGSGKDDVPHANHVGSESGKRDAKKNKTPATIALPRQKISKPSPKQKISILPDETPPKVEGKEDTGSGLEYNNLNQSLKFRNVPTMPVPSSPKIEGKEDTGSGLKYNYLNQSLKFRNGPTMPVPPQNLGEIVAKKGWDSAKTFDATSLNKRWKEVMIAETKAYLVRLDLVFEQTKLMLDELLSADS